MSNNSIREDKEVMQTVFQDIGNTLSNAMPKQWKKVVFGFFISSAEKTTHMQLWADYNGGDDYANVMKECWEDSAFLNTMELLEKKCIKLHADCAAVHDAWNEMTFLLYDDGEFSVDFSYAVISNFDTRFVMDWQSRFLE